MRLLQHKRTSYLSFRILESAHVRVSGFTDLFTECRQFIVCCKKKSFSLTFVCRQKVKDVWQTDVSEEQVLWVLVLVDTV